MPTSTTGHSVTPLAVGTAGYTLSCSGAVTPSASQTLNLSVTAAASETVTYLHSDTLGNVIGESKADGTFTRYHYKPYGERVESQPERLGFTGHLHQKELGLTYMQARHYDPLIGRFYGNDPVSFTPGNVFSFNRYGYGNNNPYKWTDPDGRASREQIKENIRNAGKIPTPTASDNDKSSPGFKNLEKALSVAKEGISSGKVTGYLSDVKDMKIVYKNESSSASDANSTVNEKADARMNADGSVSGTVTVYKEGATTPKEALTTALHEFKHMDKSDLATRAEDPAIERKANVDADKLCQKESC